VNLGCRTSDKRCLSPFEQNVEERAGRECCIDTLGYKLCLLFITATILITIFTTFKERHKVTRNNHPLIIRLLYNLGAFKIIHLIQGHSGSICGRKIPNDIHCKLNQACRKLSIGLCQDGIHTCFNIVTVLLNDVK